MWVLEAGKRRRLVRREVLRRCRGSLAVAAIPVLAGLVFFAVGLRDDHGQPIALDAYVMAWLGVVMAALALALTRGRASLHRMLKPLPTTAADELRARLEVGLGCGCLVLASLLLVEVLFQPTLTKPTFRSQLNALEARTFQNLPGVPLLRFSVDGRESRGLVHVGALRGLHVYGMDTLGRSLWTYADYQDLTRPLPQPGQTLIRFGRDNWKELDEYSPRHLRRLGLSEESEVEVTLERYVSESEYLSRRWRRDGLRRDRAWPLLDRAVSFLSLLAMFIALTTVWSKAIISAQYFVAGMWFFLLRSTELWRRWIWFSEVGPFDRIQIPSFSVLHNPFDQLIFPAAVAGVSLLSCRWSYRALRCIYAEIDVNPIKVYSISRLLAVAGLTIFLFSIGQCLALPEPSSTIPLQPNHHSVAKVVWVGLSVVWLTAFVYLVTTPVRLAQRWARRDPLLSRLPVQPREVALKRLRLFVAYEVLLLVIPLMLELLVGWAWVAFGGSARRQDVVVVTGQADAIGSTAFVLLLAFALAVVILVLMLYSRALARAAIVVAAVSLFLGPSMIVYGWSSTPMMPVLAVILAAGFVAAFRQMKRNVSWGRLAVLQSATRAPTSLV